MRRMAESIVWCARGVSRVYEMETPVDGGHRNLCVPMKGANLKQ